MAPIFNLKNLNDLNHPNLKKIKFDVTNKEDLDNIVKSLMILIFLLTALDLSIKEILRMLMKTILIFLSI